MWHRTEPKLRNTGNTYMLYVAYVSVSTEPPDYNHDNLTWLWASSATRHREQAVPRSSTSEAL